MAKCRRILCAVLSVAMMLSIIPMGTLGASAAEDVAFNTAAVTNGEDGKTLVPTVTLSSTKVIRVAADANGSTFANGTTIVPATPSGLPQINSGYTAQFYCDETPVSPTVVFTTDTELAAAPSISCENNTGVTFSAPVQSGNTYTWTITGGTGVTVGELKFVVDYSVSYTDSITGKTVTNYFKAYTTSHVDTIAQPGALSIYRSRSGNTGHENPRCSYILRILGASTYGGFCAYNDENDASSAMGYYDFIQNNWVDLGSTNQAMGYGTFIYQVSDDSGDGNVMINANADHWRPMSTTYVDRGLNASLNQQLNLRMTHFERQGNRKDGYSYYARYSRMKFLEGNVYAHTDAISSNSVRLELGISQDLVSDVPLDYNAYTNVPFNGTTYDSSSTVVEATGNHRSEYTMVYSGGSHYSNGDVVSNADATIAIIIESYDKSELRAYIQELLEDHDPTTKIAADSEIGIYPQSWFYSDGWDSYKSALQNAQAVLNKPNTTQNDINAALSTLETAVDGLKVAEANYEVVDIANAEADKLDPLNYTEASWLRLVAARDAAAEAQGYSIFYQSSVDKLAMDIEEAIDNLDYATADWSLVDTALEAYENLHPELYTPASWANLRLAVNAAEDERAKVPAYTVADQAYVDGLAKAISDAIAALQDALADYSDFEELEQYYYDVIVPENDAEIAKLAAAGINIEDYGLKSIYDTKKWNALQTILKFERDLTWQYQEDVNDATQSLSEKIEQLTYASAVYTEVEAAEEAAWELEPDWWTPESWAVLEDALLAAEEGRGKDIRSQAEVNTMAQDIYNAIEDLEPAMANYDDVLAYEDIIGNLDPSLYTQESLQAVYDIFDNINWNLEAKDQDIVDGYVTALEEAIENLDYLPADYSEVRAAEQRWENIADKTIYTNASVAAVTKAISDVTEGLDITKQDEVDAMAEAINDAIDNLQLKGASYDELKAALSAAQAELDKHEAFKQSHGVGYYTDDTIAILINAIEAVPVDANGAVIEDKNINEQADVDALTQALVNAMNLEINGADYSALDAILLTVPSDADLENLYTVDSASALMLAVINANAVDRNLKVDEQDVIDALVAEVDEAIKNLEYKPADYTIVETAILAARAKLAEGIWTAASAQDVEDAINAVDYTKDINGQEAVNAMAKAIDDAAAVLVPEYANYDKVTEAKAEADKINTAIVTPESYAKVTEAINAVVEGLYAKDQATVDGYAKAITDAIADLEYLYADWSKVDNLYTEISNLDSELYTNYDEVYYLYVYPYYNNDVATKKSEYIYIDKQADIDLMYEMLLAYKDMLELKPEEPDPEPVVESFEAAGTTVFKTQRGVNYIYGLKEKLTTRQFESSFVTYENVTLEYELTTARWLGTGSIVRVISNSTNEVIAEYIIVIYGDVDGSAVVDSEDATYILDSINGVKSPLENEYKLAANVSGTRANIDTDDKIALDDVIKGSLVIDQVSGKAE